MSKSGDLKGRAEDASLVVAASGGGRLVMSGLPFLT